LRKRVALGVSIPAVLLFIGILVALLMPSNMFVLTEALSGLGLLGSRQRIPGIASNPPGAGPAPPLEIVNGRVWDAAGGLRDNPGLHLSDGRIAREPTPGARVIDASGMTILPGLIDMHIHSFGGTFTDEMLIGNGVTSARDLGSQLAGILEHRAASAAGERIAPRLFVTGPYIVGAEGTSDQEIGAATPEAAAAVVERFADAGVDGIKVHWGIDAPRLRAIVDAAHRRGLWVAAHLDEVDPVEAARIGVDTIEHAFTLIGRDRQEEDSIIRTLVDLSVALTPTLVISEHAFTLPDLARTDNPALRYFPFLLRRMWIASQVTNAAAGSLSEEEIRRRRARLAEAERLVARFHRAGGTVLAGSDAPAFLVAPGFDLHRELELLVESGLTAEEALTAATLDAAASLGRESDLGGLAPGMRADLLIVRGDPLSGPEGISATRNAVFVVKDGHLLLNRAD